MSLINVLLLSCRDRVCYKKVDSPIVTIILIQYTLFEVWRLAGYGIRDLSKV